MRMKNCGRYGINSSSSITHDRIAGGVIAQSNTGIFNTATLPWIQFLSYPSAYRSAAHDLLYGIFPDYRFGMRRRAGATINANSDYDYMVKWGSAGRRGCTVTYGLAHNRGAEWTGITAFGTVNTGAVTTNPATGQTFVLQTAPSSGAFHPNSQSLGWASDARCPRPLRPSPRHCRAGAAASARQRLDPAGNAAAGVRPAR